MQCQMSFYLCVFQHKWGDVCVHSCVWLFGDPMDCSPPWAPLPMEFSRQEYWSGLTLDDIGLSLDDKGIIT